MLLQHLLISTKHTANLAKNQAAICVTSCTNELKLIGNIPWERSVLSELPSSPHMQTKLLSVAFWYNCFEH